MVWPARGVAGAGGPPLREGLSVSKMRQSISSWSSQLTGSPDALMSSSTRPPRGGVVGRHGGLGQPFKRILARHVAAAISFDEAMRLGTGEADLRE